MGLNLVPAIQAIEKEINKLEIEFNKMVQPYRDSLEQLKILNTACERCCGKGRILRSRVCAEDDRSDPSNPNDYVNCGCCNGTGKKG